VNEQEAFNEIWDHFIVKGSPPGNDEGDTFCCLRTRKGNCCHVGRLIPDEQYNEGLECAATDPFSLMAKVPILQHLSKEFLDEIREAHDEAASFVDFTARDEKNLRQIAKDFNLTIPASSPQMGQEKTSCPSIA
jgi:hypothetical protein